MNNGMRPIGQGAVDEVWSALRFRPARLSPAHFSRELQRAFGETPHRSA